MAAGRLLHGQQKRPLHTSTVPTTFHLPDPRPLTICSQLHAALIKLDSDGEEPDSSKGRRLSEEGPASVSPHSQRPASFVAHRRLSLGHAPILSTSVRRFIRRHLGATLDTVNIVRCGGRMGRMGGRLALTSAACGRYCPQAKLGGWCGENGNHPLSTHLPTKAANARSSGLRGHAGDIERARMHTHPALCNL